MTETTDCYPDDWELIAKATKDLANWECENCQHPHEPSANYTLTVHHLNGIKSDCRASNLVALCQRCHLSIEAKYQPGQLTLPLINAPAWLRTRVVQMLYQRPETSP